jgi:hypothetical protein
MLANVPASFAHKSTSLALVGEATILIVIGQITNVSLAAKFFVDVNVVVCITLLDTYTSSHNAGRVVKYPFLNVVSATLFPVPANVCSHKAAIIGSNTTKKGVVVSTLFLTNVAFTIDNAFTILEVVSVAQSLFVELHSISNLPQVWKACTTSAKNFPSISFLKAYTASGAYIFIMS